MDKKLEALIEKSDLTQEELVMLLKSKKPITTPQRKTRRLPVDGDEPFIAMSCTHMGHKNYRADILEHANKYGKKRGAKYLMHSGDICEGVSGRDGHVFELSHLGASEQVNYAVEQLGQFDIPIFAITATNSHDGWFHSKGNAGFEVGPELERRIDNFTFLGQDEADVQLGNGLIVRLTHPGDGTAYAISYKMQRYLNSLSGGKKPHIVLQGHYHKSAYLFYRGVHAFDVGCLQEQTIFMKKKQTPAMLGYWIIEPNGTKKGVESIKQEFVPFYE